MSLFNFSVGSEEEVLNEDDPNRRKSVQFKEVICSEEVQLVRQAFQRADTLNKWKKALSLLDTVF